MQSSSAYLSGSENARTHAYVYLSKIPILVRRAMLQPWIAFAYRLLLSSQEPREQLLVIEEGERALKGSAWVWDVIEMIAARGVRLVLTD